MINGEQKDFDTKIAKKIATKGKKIKKDEEEERRRRRRKESSDVAIWKI